MVKQNRSNGDEVVRVKVDNRALSVSLEKLPIALLDAGTQCQEGGKI